MQVDIVVNLFFIGKTILCSFKESNDSIAKLKLKGQYRISNASLSYNPRCNTSAPLQLLCDSKSIIYKRKHLRKPTYKVVPIQRIPEILAKHDRSERENGIFMDICAVPFRDESQFYPSR